jgi:hypothetical protein
MIEFLVSFKPKLIRAYTQAEAEQKAAEAARWGNVEVDLVIVAAEAT